MPPAPPPRRTLAFFVAILALVGRGAHAQELDPFGPPPFSRTGTAAAPTDPPAGLFVVPVLGRDEVELGLVYRTRRFDGLRDGDRTLDPEDLLGSPYGEVPVQGSRERFELSAAWAATEDLTLSLLVPLEQRMREVQALGGGRHRVRTQGLGDVELVAAWRALGGERSEVVLDLGVSAPTGAIDESAVTPSTAGESAQLPYELQLGSGSFELLPGLSWAVRRERWSFGARARGRLPLDTNERGWKVGESVEASGYAAFSLSQELAGSLRLAFAHLEPYDGSDPDLDPGFDPGHDPARLGRSSTELLAGFAWSPARGRLSGFRLSAEAGMPVWQEVDGPGLEADWSFALSLALDF